MVCEYDVIQVPGITYNVIQVPITYNVQFDLYCDVSGATTEGPGVGVDCDVSGATTEGPGVGVDCDVSGATTEGPGVGVDLKVA